MTAPTYTDDAIDERIAYGEQIAAAGWIDPGTEAVEAGHATWPEVLAVEDTERQYRTGVLPAIVWSTALGDGPLVVEAGGMTWARYFDLRAAARTGDDG